MRELHLDFETASKADLKKVGADVYSRHPSTRVLMLAWGFSDADLVRVWEPHLGSMPEELRAALTDRNVLKIAHNAAFEIAIFRNTLKIPVDVHQWRCAMVMALSLGLPGKLELLVRDALQLGRQFWKDPEGDKLMRVFSFPASRATWESHPVEWAKYVGYCRQDVIAEKRAYKVLSRYVENVEQLFKGWVLDQRINATGLPVDYGFITAAKTLADEAKKKCVATLKEWTGLQNPNSTKQLAAWLHARGYPFASLAKNRAQIAMRAEDGKLTDEAKKVLQLRFDSNKTSLAKFDALERASFMGRLRGTFQYYGAAATGRWAGRILGQNMPRPWKGVEAFLAEVRHMITDYDLEGLEFFFGKPLDAIVSSIRSAIKAPEGKKFVVADLASIELVVIAWLTDASFWLDVVRSGKDAYKAFAEQWLGVPYAEVTKQQRNDSKPPALGCGYRMGPGREVGVFPDTEKTGLWGYGANMGIDLTKEQCKTAVKVYRSLSPEIVEWWHLLERAALECVAHGEPQQVGRIIFDLKAPFLRMRLPSGRCVHYCRPRIEQVEIEFEDEETGEIIKTKKVGLTYERASQKSGKWVRRPNHGGRFIEQAVQAIARDILEIGLVNADAHGFEVVGHYHDEILTLVDVDSPLGLEDLIKCMTRLPKWAAGMPCRAEGYEDDFYHK